MCQFKHVKTLCNHLAVLLMPSTHGQLNIYCFLRIAIQVWLKMSENLGLIGAIFEFTCLCLKWHVSLSTVDFQFFEFNTGTGGSTCACVQLDYKSHILSDWIRLLGTSKSYLVNVNWKSPSEAWSHLNQMYGLASLLDFFPIK